MQNTETKQDKTPGQHHAHFKALKGRARAAYFEVNWRAIWQHYHDTERAQAKAKEEQQQANAADAARINWLEKSGASIMRAMAPDMGGRNWFVTAPGVPSARRVRAATVRNAIDDAIAAAAK